MARRMTPKGAAAPAPADVTPSPGRTGSLLHAARLTAITEFCSAVTHDINQPVSAVVTNAHTALRWLNRPTPNLDEVRQALERITRDADRTRQMIARAGAQLTQTRPAARPLDINDLIREALAVMGADAGQARIHVETALEPALPAVLADAALLQQAAINLISNALEAMGEARGRPHVLHLSSRRWGAAEIAVLIADTGVGFGPDDTHKAFQPFYTTKAGGLGLGLSISRSIIEGCGGRLTAAPNHPHGTVFTVILPIAGSAP